MSTRLRAEIEGGGWRRGGTHACMQTSQPLFPASLPPRSFPRPMFVHKSLAGELGPAITPFDAVDLVVEKSKPREDDDA